MKSADRGDEVSLISWWSHVILRGVLRVNTERIVDENGQKGKREGGLCQTPG